MFSGVFGRLDRQLSNLSIGMRIALLVAVPTIGLIMMGLQLSLTSLGHFSEGKHVLDIAHSVPVMSSVVHEMQIERGMTSGFMSSGGTQFAN